MFADRNSKIVVTPPVLVAARVSSGHALWRRLNDNEFIHGQHDRCPTPAPPVKVTTLAYGPSNQLVTSVNSAGTTTYTYDFDGNLTRVAEPTNQARTTMSYDGENRLKVHEHWDNGMMNPQVATYLYEGGGLKRVENVDGQVTTIVWDGDEYLGEVQ